MTLAPQADDSRLDASAGPLVPPTAAGDDGGLRFALAGEEVEARPSGALWRPGARMLVVADLHLGKSERIARRGGPLLPPYETAETLDRLGEEIARLGPRRVVCLGDSFDDLAASALPVPEVEALARLMAGRRWTWIEGNHDPGPTALGGEHLSTLRDGALVFRHEAADAGATPPGAAEVSGHFHPKARLAGGARRCFVLAPPRLILPAFGRYTGGLDVGAAALRRVAPAGLALLVGAKVMAAPLERLRGG